MRCAASYDGRRGDVLDERILEEVPVCLALQRLLEGALVGVRPHELLQVLLHHVVGVPAEEVLGQHDALGSTTHLQAGEGVVASQRFTRHAER